MGRLLDVIAPPGKSTAFRWDLASSRVAQLGDGIRPGCRLVLATNLVRVAVLVLLVLLATTILGGRISVGVLLVALLAVGTAEIFADTGWRAVLPSIVGSAVPFGDGLRWVGAHPPVRTLVLVIFAFNVTWGAPWGVLVYWAQQRLGVGAVGFGPATPFWFAFAGSALTLAVVRRQLDHITHADERTGGGPPG